MHAALAEVTDPQADLHRPAGVAPGQAAGGPDQEVAAELERSAGRAQARGGLAATAAFLERPVLLTADPARHAERTLAAAQASMPGRRVRQGCGTAGDARTGRSHEIQHRAAVDLLRAHVAFAWDLAAMPPRCC